MSDSDDDKKLKALTIGGMTFSMAGTVLAWAVEKQVFGEVGNGILLDGVITGAAIPVAGAMTGYATGRVLGLFGILGDSVRYGRKARITPKKFEKHEPFPGYDHLFPEYKGKRYRFRQNFIKTGATIGLYAGSTLTAFYLPQVLHEMRYDLFQKEEFVMPPPGSKPNPIKWKW